MTAAYDAKDIRRCSPLNDPLELVLALGLRGKRAGSGVDICCPSHDDRNPSCSVFLGEDGTVGVKCHACGWAGDALTLVGAVRGIAAFDDIVDEAGRMTAASPREPKSKIVATYDYRDETGALLYQVCRKEPKAFIQRRPNGNDWIYKLGEIRRVPYRLAELVRADPEARVYVVEGEKDADRLAALGFVSTCNAGGAGKFGFIKDLSPFVNRKVTVIADKDEPGRAHAAQVVAALRGIARGASIVEVPTGKDVSDWIDAGATAADIVALSEPPKPKRRGRTPVEILDVMASQPVIHLPTGIRALDDATGGGPRFRDLVSVLGAPDAGKTLLLAQIADTLSVRNDLIVAEYCVDEDGEDNVTRLAQRRGWLRSEVEKRCEFADLRTRLPTLQIFGDDDKLEDVIRELATFSAETCRRVVLFVDSLQTIGVASVPDDASPTERVAKALTLLKKACSCGWIVFLTSEMVRSSYSGTGERTSTLAAAKWSGDVEYKSKIQLGVRNVEDSDDLIEIDISKNKAGPKTKFHMKINRARQELELVDSPAEQDSDASKATSAKTAGDAERMLKVILRHPGMGTKDLRARTQLGAEACSRALYSLIDSGQVEDRPEQRGARSFPHYYAVPK